MFRYAATELYGVELDKVVFKTVKNSDLRESILEVNGEPVLNIAVVNGFRNIQNLVQKLKRKKCGYHYVSATFFSVLSSTNSINFIFSPLLF